jgi:amino acid transporter
MSKVQAAVKRVLLGRPMSSGELEHTLLPKTIALPVFSSDPLSSNAYATQEALIVLALAGAAGLTYILPISLAVATLLTIVVISYRETVRAYPTGGGAYRVSRENLGMYPGLVAASALLTDYVLTVAVSMTAGVDAIVSAAESLAPYKIQLAIGFVTLVTLANLRGAKESGRLFAIPTYGFVLSIYIMLGTGFVRCLGGCPQAESAGMELEPHQAITFVLILRAFAAGTTALTGVEAIADGVGAFRYPQSRNAATTLAIMAALSISMFLGISWLADHTNVVYVHEEGVSHQRTVVAQIAAAVFNEGFLFYVVQAMSAAILLLAANTAYQDFPRIASILAQDDFFPHQFRNRGDRLVFSNGIIILAVLASLLIVAFNADLNRLIQLYLVGVFISFTLSQWGMVRRAVRFHPAGWRRTIGVSGFGGTVTGIVLLVIAYSKFSHGAWMVLTAIPILVFLMRSIYMHYGDVKAQLAHPARRPTDRRPGHQHFVVYVPKVDQAAARAIGYIRSLRPSSMEALEPARSRHPAAGPRGLRIRHQAGEASPPAAARRAGSRRLPHPGRARSAGVEECPRGSPAPASAPPEGRAATVPRRRRPRHPGRERRHRSDRRRHARTRAQLRDRPRVGRSQRDVAGDRVRRDAAADGPSRRLLRARSRGNGAARQ